MNTAEGQLAKWQSFYPGAICNELCWKLPLRRCGHDHLLAVSAWLQSKKSECATCSFSGFTCASQSSVASPEGPYVGKAAAVNNNSFCMLKFVLPRSQAKVQAHDMLLLQCETIFLLHLCTLQTGQAQMHPVVCGTAKPTAVTQPMRTGRGSGGCKGSC